MSKGGEDGHKKGGEDGHKVKIYPALMTMNNSLQQNRDGEVFTDRFSAVLSTYEEKMKTKKLENSETNQDFCVDGTIRADDINDDGHFQLGTIEDSPANGRERDTRPATLSGYASQLQTTHQISQIRTCTQTLELPNIFKGGNKTGKRQKIKGLFAGIQSKQDLMGQSYPMQEDSPRLSQF